MPNWPEYFEPLGLDSVPSAAAMKFDLSEDHFRKLLLEGVNDVATAASGGVSGSTPIAVAVNVTDTLTQLIAANVNGQFVSVTNNGEATLLISDGADPHFEGGGFPTHLGIFLPPGATWESPRQITTAVKGIASTGEQSAVTATRYP